MKIISGGQFGADRGALEGAKEIGFETGGTAPPRWMTEKGPQKVLLQGYNLVEGEYDAYIYPKRTMKNVDDSDGTLAILWGPSIGTLKTLGYCQTKRWIKFSAEFRGYPYKPFFLVTVNDIASFRLGIKEFIMEHNITTLNVAGHRESSQPGIQEFTKNLIKSLI